MSFQNKKNIYTCEKCHEHIVTVDLDGGVTPFMIECKCTSGCKGMMTSSMYRVFEQSMNAGWEWYRPTDLSDLSEWSKEHVRKGGLMLRKASAPPQSNVVVTLEEYFERQIEWSRETFGPALRTGGVIDHIRKELREIEAEPHDLSEWVDVVILAMDGFWRHGGKASDLLPALLAKQRKNMTRNWPDWRNMSENSAIEHDRSSDTATTEGSDNG